MTSFKPNAAACGPDCLAAVLQDGPSKGSWIDVGGIKSYIALPESLVSVEEAESKKFKSIVLWFCDVYGANFINNQLLMDYFASRGLLVVSPDYFWGDEIEHKRDEPGFSIHDWVGQFVRPSDGKTEGNRTADLLAEWVPAIKQRFGASDAKYGCIGYCFGCPYVLQYCSGDEVDCGVMVHPAFLDDDKQFENIKQPLFTSAAEQDAYFSPARRHSLEAHLTRLSTPSSPEGLSAGDAGGGVEWALQVFGGVKHGWAIRGDMSVPRIRWAREESARSCSGWFERFLK